MFEILDYVVKEIGEDNVVQVVTNDTSNFVGARKNVREENKIIFASLCNSLPWFNSWRYWLAPSIL